jgi:hypothetical protein
LCSTIHLVNMVKDASVLDIGMLRATYGSCWDIGQNKGKKEEQKFRKYSLADKPKLRVLVQPAYVNL